MAPATRKLCYFSSSCHLLFRPAGLQPSSPFAKSSLSHHGATTSGNTLKNRNHGSSNLFESCYEAGHGGQCGAVFV